VLYLTTVNLTRAPAPAAVFGIDQSPDASQRFLTATAIGFCRLDDALAPPAVQPWPGVEPEAAEHGHHAGVPESRGVRSTCSACEPLTWSLRS
jgi:hypothetical protein